MKRILIIFFLNVGILNSQETAFEELLKYSNDRKVNLEVPQPKQSESEFIEAKQWLPPNNNEPGFEWPKEISIYKTHEEQEHFIFTDKVSTFLKLKDEQSSELGTAEKCALNPNTKYTLNSKPDFYGDHIIAELSFILPGCSLNKGYIYMEHIASNSAGGFWQLPPNIKAFLDTLAYAEGTESKYNYIFTFVTFKSYKDHPRIRKCRGRLCSTAAGRYQFLEDTWDALASDLGLKDFTPPNQDKAVMEIIRRAGAYKAVLNSSKYENFVSALNKLNGIWASLPGSPYGQPTHSTASLWKYYKTRLALYK